MDPYLSGLILSVCVLLPEPGEDGSVGLPRQPVPANHLNQGQYRGWYILYYTTTPEHKCTPGDESIGENKEFMVILQKSNLALTPVLWIRIRSDPKLLTGSVPVT
jgi:hypothetical protein